MSFFFFVVQFIYLVFVLFFKGSFRDNYNFSVFKELFGEVFVGYIEFWINFGLDVESFFWFERCYVWYIVEVFEDEFFFFVVYLFYFFDGFLVFFVVQGCYVCYLDEGCNVVDDISVEFYYIVDDLFRCYGEVEVLVCYGEGF